MRHNCSALGTLVGIMQNDRTFIPDSAGQRSGDPSPFIGYDKTSSPIAILAENELLAINLNGATLSGNSLACHVRWEEVAA